MLDGKTLHTTFDGGFHIGLTIAAVLANAFAFLVRRDTRLNLWVAAACLGALAFLLWIG